MGLVCNGIGHWKGHHAMVAAEVLARAVGQRGKQGRARLSVKKGSAGKAAAPKKMVKKPFGKGGKASGKAPAQKGKGKVGERSTC